MFTLNNIRFVQRLATKLTVILLIFVIWFLPGLQILSEIIFPSTNTMHAPTTGLVSSPPPWLTQQYSAFRQLELGWKSLRLGFVAAIISIPVSLMIAFCFTRCHWPGRKMIQKLWQSLIFIPLPITAAIWLGSFSNLGRTQAFGVSTQPIISGWLAAGVVHAAAILPLLVWIFGSVMIRSPNDLEDLARLSFPFPYSFFQSTITQIMPAIIASAIVILMQTAGDMTVTDLVQERTFAEEAYLQAQMGDGLSAAASTAMPPTIFLIAILSLWFCYHKKYLLHLNFGNSEQFSTKIYFQSKKAIMSSFISVLATIILWALPLVAIFWRAGRAGGIANLNQLPTWSLKNLLTNLVAASADLLETGKPTFIVCASTALLSVLLAWFVVESAVKSRLIGALLLFGCAFGLATPGPVAGLATLWVWMPIRTIYDSLLIVIIAQLFRIMPVAVIWVWPTITYRAMSLNDMVLLDDLSTFEKFRRIGLPLTAPLLTATFFIIFAMAFAELPASNIVAPPGLELFSIRLWGLMHTGLESHLSAVVLLSMLLITSAGIALSLLTLKLAKIFEKKHVLMK